MAIPVSGTGAVPYEVNLAWDAPASSADAVAGYNVYRTLSGASSYQLLNSGASLTATTFTDTTVEDGQVYVYYVTSVDGSGVESVPSNAFDVTIP
jgi:fibronectin type 3 domain-containing protein